MTGQDSYAEVASKTIDRVLSTQHRAIAEAGQIIAEALQAGGVLQTFGTGHSRAVALELVGRAGGVVPVNQLAIRDLVYYGSAPPADILDPLLERETGVAERIWELADIRAADAFLIVSNSGGNGAIVEMASLAKQRGHRLVAITSQEHTNRVTSRLPSGDRLIDIADVAIDNCAPYGDAALHLSSGETVCPVSNLSGILIANMLVAEVVSHYEKSGARPPIFRSANTPGGDEHNADLLSLYGGRVRLGDA